MIRRVEHIESRVDSTLESISQGKDVGFEKLEEEASRITREVAELSKFIRLNYSAFMKVILYRFVSYALDFEKARQAYFLYVEKFVYGSITGQAILQT